MIEINALGDTCPIPVVKTKNVIKGLKKTEDIHILVDNEIAVQNLTKMAVQKGYAVKSEKLKENKYQVIMSVVVAGEANNTAAVTSSSAGNVEVFNNLFSRDLRINNLVKAGTCNNNANGNLNKGVASNSVNALHSETQVSCIPDRRSETVVVISSDRMGEGNDELGAVLIKGFIYALASQDNLPATILFYNGGAKLTCDGSPAIEDLKSMEAQGVEILTCGTCLDYYGLTPKLMVGGVTNMYVITEKMMNARLIVKP